MPSPVSSVSLSVPLWPVRSPRFDTFSVSAPPPACSASQSSLIPLSIPPEAFSPAAKPIQKASAPVPVVIVVEPEIAWTLTVLSPLPTQTVLTVVVSVWPVP